jgi:hypothetical protein
MRGHKKFSLSLLCASDLARSLPRPGPETGGLKVEHHDIRRYRDEGSISFEYEVPRPDGRTLMLDVEDQGLVIAAMRTPLNGWSVRVNPAGGEDVCFPHTPVSGDPGRLKVQLAWKRGGHMALWLNDDFVGYRPFTPPAVN